MAIMANVGSKKRGSKLQSVAAFGHDRQNQGHSVGNGQKKAVTDRPGQYPANVGGKKNMVHNAPMANVGKDKGKLISEPGFGHSKQNQGHSIGTGQKTSVTKGPKSGYFANVGGGGSVGGGEKHIFGGHPAVGADGYGHPKSACNGPYERLSGVAGAHRLGRKK